MRALKAALDLLESSQARNSFGDVEFLLTSILEQTGFDGVILWLPWREEFPKPDGKAYEAKVQAAASLFRNKPDQHVFHSLSSGSKTALGIVNLKPWTGLEDPSKPTDDEDERRIIEHFEIYQTTGIPFSIGETKETTWRRSIVGSLNFYRCGPRLPESHETESEEELYERLKDFTRLFSHGFTSMVDAVGVRFIKKLEGILSGPNAEPESHESLRGDTVKRVSAELEEAISSTIPCREVCLHLLGEDLQRETISCTGGIWPWKTRVQCHEYEIGVGITGGCFRERKTLIVGDAIELTRTGGIYNCTPPFLDEDAKQAGLERDINGRFAPVSVVAVPLMDGLRAIGVLFCAGKSQSPYFFGLHEVFFLEQAGALIAKWYGRQIERFREKKAARSTLAIVKAVSSFAAKVEKMAGVGNIAPKLDPADLLGHWISALPAKTNICIRMLAHGNNDEFVRDFSKPAPNHGPRTKAPPAGFSWRHYDQKLRCYFETTGPLDRWPEPPWSASTGAESALVFPLYGKPDEVRGAVEVDSPEPSAFSEQDRQLCYLFSNMTSLASVMQHYVQAGGKAIRDQHEAQVAQEKAFKLLAHQVNTPLSTALGWIERVVQRAAWKTIAPEKLRDAAIESQRAVRRAWRVVQRMRVFSELATDEKISKIEIQPIPSAVLFRHLQEIAEDYREVAAHRRMTIAVTQGKEKESDGGSPAQGDIDLLNQAVEILLENAVKYGDEGTRIEIVHSSGNYGKNQLIAIRNSARTTPLRISEVPRAADFGVRLDRAISTKRGGWGAGLYIAKHIMTVHKGQLIVSATSERDKTTTFTLSIPTGLQP